MEITGGKKGIEGCRRMKQAKTPTRNPMGAGGEHVWTLGSRYKLTSPLSLPSGRPLSSVSHQATPGVSTGSWAPSTLFRGPLSLRGDARFLSRSATGTSLTAARARVHQTLRALLPRSRRSSPVHQTPGGHASFSAPAPPFKYPWWPIREKASRGPAAWRSGSCSLPAALPVTCSWRGGYSSGPKNFGAMAGSSTAINYSHFSIG